MRRFSTITIAFVTGASAFTGGKVFVSLQQQQQRRDPFLEVQTPFAVQRIISSRERRQRLMATSAGESLKELPLTQLQENFCVFKNPGEGDNENEKFIVVFGSEAKQAMEEREWRQVETTLVSSAQEVSEVFDGKDADGKASNEELDVALQTALMEHYKSEEERFDALQTLVAGGACITRTKSMMRAASDVYHGAKNLKILLELGGSVEDRDAYGSTALHIACVFCNADAVEVLLQNGADVEAIDEDGLTPKDAFDASLKRNQELKIEYGYGSTEDQQRETKIQNLFGEGMDADA